MVTPIRAKIASNGTGRDGYIVCEATFKHGARHSPKEAKWKKNLRDYAKEFGDDGPAGTSLWYPPSQRPQQRSPDVIVAAPDTPGRGGGPRHPGSARSAWVPPGGAPRPALARAALSPRAASTLPAPVPSRAPGASCAGPGPLWLEVGRALLLEELPRPVSCEPTRPRGAALHRPQLLGQAPTAWRMPCRDLDSATAARAAHRMSNRCSPRVVRGTPRSATPSLSKTVGEWAPATQMRPASVAGVHFAFGDEEEYSDED